MMEELIIVVVRVDVEVVGDGDEVVGGGAFRWYFSPLLCPLGLDRLS